MALNLLRIEKKDSLSFFKCQIFSFLSKKNVNGREEQYMSYLEYFSYRSHFS